MKTTTIWVLILFLIFGTAMQGCKQSGTPETIITIDTKASYPKKEIILQDFMDVEYIPLETNDEFITQGDILAIGRKFIAAKNYINDGNIYLFDRKTGKGVRVINRKGQGDEEYTFINSIILDEEKNEMLVNCASIKKILVYDLSGNFKRSFNHTEGTEYLEVHNYDKDNLICYDMTIYNEEGEKRSKEFYHAIVSKQDGSITQEIPIPFDVVKSPYIREGDGVVVASVRAIIPYRENWLLVETSSDTVYSYAPDKNKLSPFLVKKPTVNPEMLLTVGTVTDRYYFIQAIEKTFNFETRRGFKNTGLMYDKQENTVYEPVVYNADYTNKQKVDLFSRSGNREIATYQNLAAYQLVEAYNNNELNGNLKQITAELDDESNPVIMLIKYR